MKSKDIPPNLALDAMIAEEVMGWPVVEAGEEEWFEKVLGRGVRPPFFAYWPQGGNALYKDDIGLDAQPWSPSSNARHAADALMARFNEHKIRIIGAKCKDSPEPGFWVIEISNETDLLARESDLRYELAVAKAMLAAARKEKEAEES